MSKVENIHRRRILLDKKRLSSRIYRNMSMLSLVIGASRRGSTGGSAFVRAFCPRTSSVLSGNTKSAYRVTGARAPTIDWSSFSTSSQKDGLKISSTVDDDLDAALDSILGDAISKIDDSMDSTSIPPPQKNKLASTLVEEVRELFP